MLLQPILFIAGIAGVYFGAEWLVKGSSKLSRDLGIKPIVIGLTVVAFGTSSPELAVSLTASIKKSNDIAIGNIIGSNIANIGLILGISAVVVPLKVEKVLIKRELPLMIGISAVLYYMAMDRQIGFIDGLILFTGIIVFIGYQVYSTMNSKKGLRNSIGNTEDASALAPSVNPSCKKVDPVLSNDNAVISENSEKEHQTGGKLLIYIGYIIIGLACLLVGSHMLVKSAIMIAGWMGISEMVIGMSVVAFGTSVPEMATSVVSALRKEADICVGNVIGSNIFNILMVLGSVALVRPINVTREVLFFEFPIMLLFSFALIPMIRGNLRVNRFSGFVLASGYFAFIFFLFYR